WHFEPRTASALPDGGLPRCRVPAMLRDGKVPRNWTKVPQEPAPWCRRPRAAALLLQLLGLADEVRDGLRLHLLHHLGAMRLDGALGDLELGRDLLVEQPRHDAGEHLAFAHGQRLETRGQLTAPADAGIGGELRGEGRL